MRIEFIKTYLYSHRDSFLTRKEDHAFPDRLKSLSFRQWKVVLLLSLQLIEPVLDSSKILSHQTRFLVVILQKFVILMLFDIKLI